MIIVFKRILEDLINKSMTSRCPGAKLPWSCIYCKKYFTFGINDGISYDCPCTRYRDNKPQLIEEVKTLITKLEDNEIIL